MASILTAGDLPMVATCHPEDQQVIRPLTRTWPTGEMMLHQRSPSTCVAKCAIWLRQDDPELPLAQMVANQDIPAALERVRSYVLANGLGSDERELLVHALGHLRPPQGFAPDRSAQRRQ